MHNSMLDGYVAALQKRGTVVLLESQMAAHPASEQSFLAAEPRHEFSVHGRQITITENGSSHTFRGDPWAALAHYRSRWNDWLFGYIGYDAVGASRPASTNADPVGAPDMYFMVPQVLLRLEAGSEAIDIIKGNRPEHAQIGRPRAVHLSELRSSTDEEAYKEAIRQAQHDIFEGEYYEINLSRQISAQFSGLPFDLYRAMREKGPVPFGAYLALDDERGPLAICCQSPERFLQKKGRHLRSQPIKGTAKRHAQPHKDEQLKQELIASPKEQAENVMIVDLVRHNLGRIAEKGSVRVPSLFAIQSFGTVHQMVSTVEATARVQDPIQIIKACFPMGSMTGAPKLRVLKAIEHYERHKRGIYSGAIGYITPSGDFDFNVVIRTALVRPNWLWYATGGAITSDADPQTEWNETCTKTEALMAAAEDRSSKF